jgi:hypothetical protein
MIRRSRSFGVNLVAAKELKDRKDRGFSLRSLRSLAAIPVWFVVIVPEQFQLRKALFRG